MLRRRADEADALGLGGPREVGVLGQETVAGMDRVDSALTATAMMPAMFRYERTGSPPLTGPIWNASSALKRCSEKRSS